MLDTRFTQRRLDKCGSSWGTGAKFPSRSYSGIHCSLRRLADCTVYARTSQGPRENHTNTGKSSSASSCHAHTCPAGGLIQCHLRAGVHPHPLAIWAVDGIHIHRWTLRSVDHASTVSLPSKHKHTSLPPHTPGGEATRDVYTFTCRNRKPLSHTLPPPSILPSSSIPRVAGWLTG